MTATTTIADLLAAPLGPDWTIEELAEQLLGAIAAQEPDAAGGTPAQVLDAATSTDRQTSRLLRPLLACLATKSAAEAGTTANLYAGDLCFKRTFPAGTTWIVGEFENRPGGVWVTLRKADAPPSGTEPQIERSSAATPCESWPGAGSIRSPRLST